ncbi:DUF6838 family protein [Sporosarcina sp. FSL K6-6792]|uniref:phage tail terminator family protein n=1 Tax=Sporosarcina sp. FSL K6-6792 TaxID=2921559 RepID=UPI0030F82590
MVANLKSLIIQQIKAVFGPLKVYDEPIKQGLKTPAFLVLIFNNEHERQLGKSSKRTYSINVTYFPDTADKRSECDQVLETFQDEFRYIDNRYHVHKVVGEVVDEVLVITFDVKVLLKELEQGTLMQRLQFGGVINV